MKAEILVYTIIGIVVGTYIGIAIYHYLRRK